MQRTVWSNEDLDTVAGAIQGWQGPGALDGLDAGRIKDYINAKPPSFGVTKKKAGPPRYRTWQIIYAAELLLNHGAAIRQALNIDVEMEEVPTSHQRAAAVRAVHALD